MEKTCTCRKSPRPCPIHGPSLPQSGCAPTRCIPFSALPAEEVEIVLDLPSAEAGEEGDGSFRD